MNDNENALKYAQEVINNGGLYTLFTHDEYTSVWGKDFNSESLFEFYFTLTEPSGGSGGEGAPMVYADNVKDWNNLVLTKDFLDLLGEDPDDVRQPYAAYLKNRTRISFQPVRPDILNIWRSIPEKQEMY